MRAALATLAGVLILAFLGATPGLEPQPAAAAASGPPKAPLVVIRGGAELRVLTRDALVHIFGTHAGGRLHERLASGTLGVPVTIELNLRGDDFTRFRVPGEVLGETIVFDPWTLPLVETERGPLPATRETVLAHELAHAVLKLRSEDEAIRQVENPVRAELGLPLRVRF